MTDRLYAVIMAGGGGTRLWPLSRRTRPKQFLQLPGMRSLFRVAVDRLAPALPPDRIYVVTVAEQTKGLQAQAPELPPENYIIEPEPRGTAAVIGLAATILEARGSDSVMACLTADHLIEAEEEFRNLLLAAEEVADEGALVTLGIAPTYPATGYGYIKRGARRGTYSGYDVFTVESFHEKPGHAKAESYLARGGYSWNSGMFIWRVDRILAEIERLMPELGKALQSISRALGTPDYERILKQNWSVLTPQTIDYGVMEKARQVAVIPAENLGWLDVGGWNRMPHVLEGDRFDNSVFARNALIRDSRGNLIYQDEAAAGERLVALLGVENLVIVETDDVLLVCHRDRSEDVRELVKALEKQGWERYL